MSVIEAYFRLVERILLRVSIIYMYGQESLGHMSDCDVVRCIPPVSKADGDNRAQCESNEVCPENC